MHLSGQAAIVTGGTAGIGLATGIALARAGARVYLTYRWGSSDEDDVRSVFAAAGAPAPTLVEADVSSDEDTRALMERVRADCERLHILVGNAAFGHVSSGLADLTQRALASTMRYSAWPFVGHVQMAKQVFGVVPRYVVGVSSIGPRAVLPGYAFLAAAKAVMETYCRYLSAELQHEPINLNVVAPFQVRTASLDATFGEGFAPFCERLSPGAYFIEPEEVASVVVALTSGLMDGVKGQVIEVDRGRRVDDHIAGLFAQREALGLDLQPDPTSAHTPSPHTNEEET